MLDANARPPLDQILLRVWGWGETKSDEHSVVLDRVTHYIDLAWRAGLLPDEIIDDICERFPILFEDGEVEHDESESKIFVFLAPCNYHNTASRR